jgi:hypothetical protein
MVVMLGGAGREDIGTISATEARCSIQGGERGGLPREKNILASYLF